MRIPLDALVYLCNTGWINRDPAQYNKILCFHAVTCHGLDGANFAYFNIYEFNSATAKAFPTEIFRNILPDMTKICAWCHHTDTKEPSLETAPKPALHASHPVSHGICRYHRIRLRNQYRRGQLLRLRTSRLHAFLSMFRRT
jgi:hypothetical protein